MLTTSRRSSGAGIVLWYTEQGTNGVGYAGVNDTKILPVSPECSVGGPRGIVPVRELYVMATWCGNCSGARYCLLGGQPQCYLQGDSAPWKVILPLQNVVLPHSVLTCSQMLLCVS